MRALLRFVAVLLVGVLLVLPSFVRATQHVSASQDSVPIRLNRGFDQPQAKCRVVPPRSETATIPAIVEHEPLQAVAPRAAADSVEPIPDSPVTRSPELLRGPPLA